MESLLALFSPRCSLDPTHPGESREKGRIGSLGVGREGEGREEGGGGMETESERQIDDETHTNTHGCTEMWGWNKGE